MGPVLREGSTAVRRFTAADAASFAAIHRDGLNIKWAGSDANMDLVKAAQLIEGPVADGWKTGLSLRFAVVDELDDVEQVVGTISLADVNRTADGGTASVGVKMLPAGRGRGSASRAIKLLCAYAFKQLGLEVLHWRTTVGNTASKMLAERCGFVLAAQVPGFGHVDGHIADGWLFAQTRPQWSRTQDRDKFGEAQHSARVPTSMGDLPIELSVPRLEQDNVVLRALHRGDAEKLVINCADAQAVRWTTVPLNYTAEHAEYFINTVVVDGWRSGATLTFAVAERASDRLLGTVDLQCKNPGSAAVGINFGPDARGTGSAEIAVRMLAAYAFDQLNFSYLHWSAMVPNWASRKLAWKLGFTLEGQIRGEYNDRGTPADHWVLTLASTDLRTPQVPWSGPAAPAR
ncbi:GNAT family N-acetyltransferase [Arthrobacter cryoconiti]|uniref:GNAT family N-acetyltransferase n=1 Tax=Arthrobacter cryoconiti TaxID=748907 RepID=A0ABV8R3H8_9MICC|nr:GNAT family protein [Arthrobacter cryoconiti]MCC9067218.1 GNAT family N-acetyltransferase [Arthrobacter cryoconiti]